MQISINLLPVNNGDCIHIRFEDESAIHNIIIDSGPASAVVKFRNLLKKIREKNESLDLLCFTHIDDDHIGAATRVFSDNQFDCSFIQRVWLNCETDRKEEKDQAKTGTVVDMSVAGMLDLQQNLLSHKVKIENQIIAGHTLTVGAASIHVLTPLRVNHNAYQDYLKEKMKNAQMSADDKSKTNGDSISLLLCCDGKRFLFTGDIHADELTEAIIKHGENDALYCTQLPHHGSSRNLTNDLLAQMNTTRFLISSGNSTDRPSAETIRILEQYEPQKEKILLCNFKLLRSITDKEHLKYHNLQEQLYSDTDGLYFLSGEES